MKNGLGAVVVLRYFIQAGVPGVCPNDAITLRQRLTQLFVWYLVSPIGLLLHSFTMLTVTLYYIIVFLILNE